MAWTLEVQYVDVDHGLWNMRSRDHVYDLVNEMMLGCQNGLDDVERWKISSPFG